MANHGEFTLSVVDTASATEIARHPSAAYAGGLTLVAGGISPSIADGLVPLNPMSLARLLLPQRENPADAAILATGTLP